jgi:ABC-type transporter Mla subunit MlaD
MKSQRANPVKIGVFVVGGLVIITGAVVFIGSGRLFRRTHPFVSYFDGGVSGLRAGAPVKFKGVEVGMVDRAQLESDSLVTGVQHVSLVFLPEAKLILHDPIDGVMEIPTVPPPLQDIGVVLRSIVDRIGRYDFEKLLDSLKTALDGVSDLSRAPELRSALTSLDKTLKGVDAAVGDLRAGIGAARSTLGSVQGLSDDLAASLRPLLASLKQATDKLQAMAVAVEATLASTRTLLDPEAPIAIELRAGLRELADTARSTRALFELLERDPAALLRGKGAREENPR